MTCAAIGYVGNDRQGDIDQGDNDSPDLLLLSLTASSDPGPRLRTFRGGSTEYVSGQRRGGGGGRWRAEKSRNTGRIPWAYSELNGLEHV